LELLLLRLLPPRLSNENRQTIKLYVIFKAYRQFGLLH
jgi:hypothetical protein